MPRNSTKRQRLPSQAGKAAAIARTKKQLLEIAGLRAAHGFCAFKDKWPSYEFDEPEALFRISKGKDTRKRYWMRVCDLNDVCMSKVAEYMGQIKKSLSLVAPELKAATDQSLIQTLQADGFVVQKNNQVVTYPSSAIAVHRESKDTDSDDSEESDDSDESDDAEDEDDDEADGDKDTGSDYADQVQKPSSRQPAAKRQKRAPASDSD